MKKKYSIIKLIIISSIALSFIILLFIIFVLIIWDSNPNPPTRPSSVPLSAEWKGGPDGGYWIEFKNKTNDTVHFKIYNDYTGELLTDSDFIFEGHRNIEISDSDWTNFINVYDGTDIQCSINDTIYFRLIPVTTINIHQTLDE